MTTCAINCSISSQQLDLASGHTRLLLPRINEFEIEVDFDNNESVGFQISDFVYGGDTYTVTVTSVKNGITQTWTRSNGVCSSPVEGSEVDLDIDVTATGPGASTFTKGGTICVLRKGKPD